MKVKHYCVECYRSLPELVKGVNSLIEGGWIPHGGISHSVDTETTINERKGYEESTTDECFMQAMVLPVD